MKLLITAFLVAFANAQSSTYTECTETNCPDGSTHQWPEYWGLDAGKDIEYFSSNPAAAVIVDCVCTHCSEFEEFQNWPAYQAKACEWADYIVCVATNCPGAVQYDYPEGWGEDASKDLKNIAENPGIAFHIDCVCTNCREYSMLDDWPAMAGNAACTTAAANKLPTTATPSAWTVDDPELCGDDFQEGGDLKDWLEKGVQCSCKYSEVCTNDHPGGAIYNDYTLGQAVIDGGVSCPNTGTCEAMTPAPTPAPTNPAPPESLTCHPTLLGLVALAAFM